MVTTQTYHLAPTKLIPNSPHPVLHYPCLLPDPTPLSVHELFESNAWRTQWVVRYGTTQSSHYHSSTHECMAVLSGRARIRFGAADLVENEGLNTRKGEEGVRWEEGGVEVEARRGDVFVIPAGVAHKTFNVAPERPFQILTPGDGHSVAESQEEVISVLENLELSGFTMLGAYPEGGHWDFVVGGEKTEEDDFARVWKTAIPSRDPVLGADREGLLGHWGDHNSLERR